MALKPSMDDWIGKTVLAFFIVQPAGPNRFRLEWLDSYGCLLRQYSQTSPGQWEYSAQAQFYPWHRIDYLVLPEPTRA